MDPATIALTVGSIFGASKSAKAAQQAAEKQANMARDTALRQEDIQRSQFNEAMNFMKQNRGLLQDYYEPYRIAGEQALGRLSNEALSPNSELYRMQQEDLERSMNAQLASRGLYGSGRGIEMLGDQQRRLGAEERNRQIGLLDRLYGGGLTAAGAEAGALTGVGNNMANLSTGLGGALSNVYGNLGQNVMGAEGALGQAKSSYYGDISQLLGTLAADRYAKSNTTANAPTAQGAQKPQNNYYYDQWGSY